MSASNVAACAEYVDWSFAVLRLSALSGRTMRGIARRCGLGYSEMEQIVEGDIEPSFSAGMRLLNLCVDAGFSDADWARARTAVLEVAA